MDVKVHNNPVWRDRANFIIQAQVEHDGDDEIREQLWTRQITDDRFEMCCIPFFIPDLALGDEVQTELDAAGRQLLKRVVRRSGNQAFWIWFEEDADRELLNSVYEGITRLGCLAEGYSKGLLAFNAESDSQAKQALEFLDSEELRGYLECVPGRTVRAGEGGDEDT